MALDGILLHKIVPEIQASLPARIQKIYQISPTEVLFQIHSNQQKKQLLISCHSQYNRMLITSRNYPTPNEPGNFIMVLRKYLEGAIFQSLTQAELDRWCVFQITRNNEIGDREELKLYVELMGKYANIILVSQEGKVIDALKRIPPFENNKRTIHPGAEFKETPSQEKKNPFIEQTINPEESLTKQFAGFSPFLASEVEYRIQQGQSFSSIMEEIQQSKSIYIANQKDEAVFHCIPLTSIGKCLEYPLFEGFDILYYHKEEKERIRQISGDIFHVVKKELKHQQTKYPRLLKEYDDALDCEKWRIYGDLLYANGVTDTKGLQSIELQDYENDEMVTIPLDPKLDGKQNANKCYNKYHKLKKGQIHLQQQISICETEIQYFQGLLEQLDQADFSTAEEIKQELIQGGYLQQKQAIRNSNKKQKPILSHEITLENGIRISYGRNNLQNEHLTFHQAHKQDFWFHTKDYHGAHVVVHSDQIDEETLRIAANIAAVFSAGRYSSSVPVNYCKVNQLKRIPGAKPGMVQLTSYQTIYIDPDIEQLEQLGILL